MTEPIRLTDKDKTKELPCRECGRVCIVTLFMTPQKVCCPDCQTKQKQEHKEKKLSQTAATADPSKLEILSDGLVNRVFATCPVCPLCHTNETMELKSISHSPNYGPRHLQGYDAKGYPQYKQDVGESVMYQCESCNTVVSYSTQHQMKLRRQNEARTVSGNGSWERLLGTRE